MYLCISVLKHLVVITPVSFFSEPVSAQCRLSPLGSVSPALSDRVTAHCQTPGMAQLKFTPLSYLEHQQQDSPTVTVLILLSSAKSSCLCHIMMSLKSFLSLSLFFLTLLPFSCLSVSVFPSSKIQNIRSSSVAILSGEHRQCSFVMFAPSCS